VTCVSGLYLGGRLLLRNDGNEIVVDQADPIVALSLELVLELAATGALASTTYGELLIGGTVRYRPVGLDSGRNLVCQRIEAT
jgi:hypothetical protein